MCECSDHQTRKSDCKHIKITLNHVKIDRNYDESFRVMERKEITLCRYCDSGNITKRGFRENKKGKIQRFECMDCRRKFSDNIGFEKMRFNPIYITRTMQMGYSGMSTRGISNGFEQEGISVSNVTIYKWLGKYAHLVTDYTNTITPQVSETWRTDEMYVKVKGVGKWLYSMIDDSTRFMVSHQISDSKYTENVKPMFKNASKQTNMIPSTLISDGAANFHDAWKSEWRQKNYLHKMTSHIRHIHMKKDMNNNKMERFNGTMRDWEKIKRGMKKIDSPLFAGFMIHYNYVKKHGGLGGKTPAEEALIHVGGSNKWLTLIRNAGWDNGKQ